MKINVLCLGLIFLSLVISTGCKDPYTPPVVSINNSFLVVEGYLDGAGTTTIKLSRTYKLADSAKVTVEQNAQVKIESSNGLSLSLTPKGGGVYELAQFSPDPAQQYRVHIITSDKKEYLSDLEKYKPSPAIDSISWRRVNEGVQLYVSTHDDQNNTNFYRWDYDETWEYHSSYFSFLEYKNKMIRQRDPSVNIIYCWSSQSSSRIFLGSSAKLAKDVISMSPLSLIPNESWMLSVKYSMLVRQYALTEKAYLYWQNMMKNTESLGSIFDAQPSEIAGNIHCLTNPSELVIGYFSAGTIQNRRTFISTNELGNWGYRPDCESFFTPSDSVDFYFGGGYYGPIQPSVSLLGKVGYDYSTLNCLDCRLRGGTNIKPSFWP